MSLVNQLNRVEELDDLSGVYLRCEPPIASPEDVVQVIIEVEGKLPLHFRPSLELLSIDGRICWSIELQEDQLSATFSVPEDLPIGDYELRVTFENLVLDSLPFEIAQAEHAAEASSFRRGLDLRIRALDAVRAGRYQDALNLNDQATQLYIQSGCMDAAARSWNELGSALLKAHYFKEAQYASRRAFTLFQRLADLEGQAAALHLLGLASTHENLDDARTAFERALAVAVASGKSDLISLKAIEALWHYSTGLAEPQRLEYYRVLVQFVFNIKSSPTRYEAIELCRTQSNRFWLFDNGFVIAKPSQLECTFTLASLVAYSMGDLPFRTSSWKAPWADILAIFSSALLTSLVLWVANTMVKFRNEESELKVRAQRNNDEEAFSVSVPLHGSQPEQEHERKLIEQWLSAQVDFQYYEELARTVGASLTHRVEPSTGLQIEMRRPHVQPLI